MRKIINQPEDFVDEILDGIVSAHPASYILDDTDPRVLRRTRPAPAGTVGIVTGGGSGHLPLFLGYIGEGLLSAAAVGNVFSSPSVDTVLAATRAANGGAGVLYLYGNYGGDVLNFDAAALRAADEGIPTKTVLGIDDVFSASRDAQSTRRGVAGIILAFKVAGAAAASGASLDEVYELAVRAVSATRTAGVGLAPTILPTVGEPTFTLPEGQMEVGIGIHGEAGVSQRAIEPAREIARTLIDATTSELMLNDGDHVAILINGLGATPLEELYVLYAEAARLITATGAMPAVAFVGEYATSLEMAGASISIMRLDAELERLLLLEASSPFYRPGTPTKAPTAHPRSSAVRLTMKDIPTADFVSPVRGAILALASAMPAYADELRDLDAALGDGDLGLTVSAGSAAMGDVARELPTRVAQSTLISAAASAFGAANPSTFASLLSRASELAAADVDDTAPMDRRAAADFGRRVGEAISSIGGAALGDKTVIDLLLPAMDALDDEDFPATLERLLDETAERQSVRGRAAWHRERSRGLRDPGSVAMARALLVIWTQSGR